MNSLSQIKFYTGWFKYTPHFRKLVIKYPFLKNLYNINPFINEWVENSPKWRDQIRLAAKDATVLEAIKLHLKNDMDKYDTEMLKIHNQYKEEVERIKNKPKSIQSSEEELTETETIKMFFGSAIYSERVELAFQVFKSEFRVQELLTVDKDSLIQWEIENIYKLFTDTSTNIKKPFLVHNPLELKPKLVSKIYERLVAGEEDTLRESCRDPFKDHIFFENLILTKAIHKYLKYLEELKKNPEFEETPALDKKIDSRSPNFTHKNGGRAKYIRLKSEGLKMDYRPIVRELIDCDLIHSETTTSDFKKIFTSGYEVQPVVWIGFDYELYYFLNEIFSKASVKKYKTTWKDATNWFKDGSDMKSYDAGNLRKSDYSNMDLAKKSAIDKCVRLLQVENNHTTKP